LEVLPGLLPALPDASRFDVGTTRHVIGAPRVLVGATRFVISASRPVVNAPRLVAVTPRCTQVHLKFVLALQGVLNLITITPMSVLYLSSGIPVTLNAGRNALLGSVTLLK
jgi:hypothetical protein